MVQISFLEKIPFFISCFFSGTGDDFWKLEEKDGKVATKGFSSWYDYCCQQKTAGCGAEGTCDPECTMPVQNRIRHLSSDVGYYLKWETDADGYPTTEHCDAFKVGKGR